VPLFTVKRFELIDFMAFSKETAELSLERLNPKRVLAEASALLKPTNKIIKLTVNNIFFIFFPD
jgi:hypothetical protein